MADKLIENAFFQSPVHPVRLSLEDTIQFHCHKAIACFNVCCQQTDVTLTPYDILRLKKRFGLTSSEFLARYTLPFEMDSHSMPGVKIRPLDNSAGCPFLCAEGCSVYEDRPTACRYYALGLLSMRLENATVDEDAYFLVKEEYCLGHHEPRTLSVQAYRQEQGVDEYDEINREWRQIILKKRSSGPTVGKPSPRSYQLFFLASYNLDDFRVFVQSPGFLEVYALDARTLEQLEFDEVALLKFAFKLLKQVLFGEMTIPLKTDAEEKRKQRRNKR